MGVEGAELVHKDLRVPKASKDHRVLKDLQVQMGVEGAELVHKDPRVLRAQMVHQV
jgi:hypothetical protein